MLGSLINKGASIKVCNTCNTSGGCFWQFYHGKVKSAGVPVLWFCTSTCFRFWSKTFMKYCTYYSLLSRDKTISCLLELIGHGHLISEYVLENIKCFRFWWNTYTKHCLSTCNITCQNTFFPSTLWLVSCFQFQGMILKMKECHVRKNIALKIHASENLDFDFVLLTFTLLS